MTAFGQYEDDDSGSTCKQRDYKDATDLVVQPTNVTQDTVAGPLDSHYWKGPGSRQGGEREYVGVVQPVTQLPIGLDEEQNAVVDGFGTLKARMLGGGFEGTVATEITGTLSSRATAAGGLGTDFEVAGGLQPTPTMAVRRLLPVECERLQGFPDDHTNIPWRGKPAPDGPRYKAMGNSMAVPVMRWIGQRLDRVAKEKR
jgi:DNA (cytosine-5)-methyltransferase 1